MSLKTSLFFSAVANNKVPEPQQQSGAAPETEEKKAARKLRLDEERRAEAERQQKYWYGRQVEEFVSLPADYSVSAGRFTAVCMKMACIPLFDDKGKAAIRKATEDNPLRFASREVREYIVKTNDFLLGDIFLQAFAKVKATNEDLATDHPTVHLIMSALNAFAAAVDVNKEDNILWTEARRETKRFCTYVLDSFPAIPEWTFHILIGVEKTGILHPPKPSENGEKIEQVFKFVQLWQRPGMEDAKIARRQSIERITAVVPVVSKDTVEVTPVKKEVCVPKPASPRRLAFEAAKVERNAKKKNPQGKKIDPSSPFAKLADIRDQFPPAQNGTTHA